MSTDTPKRFETRAIHTGYRPDSPHFDVAQPIHMSTTFERGEDGGYPGGFDYTRSGNPNRAVLEATLANLEGGEEALAFASGLAAISAVMQSLSPGDHILIADDMYFGAKVLLEDVFARWGLTHTAVNMSNPEAVAKAITPATRLLWIETPSNPLLKITDIQTIADIAHNHGAQLAVDNTWPTPLLTRPIEHGADIVMHSTSKALAGHSDVLGGALVYKVRGEMSEHARGIQKLGGAVPSPFDCWLVHRGIQTLAVRQNAACAAAQVLAERLLADPRIEDVLFPGLDHHPLHDVAMRQMDQPGSMMSILVKGGAQDALSVTHKTQVFGRATSLGGTHSLIEHRPSIEGIHTLAPPNLLRISMGLEHVDDLWDDLDKALG